MREEKAVYENVIWATDGSEAADRALAHAKALVSESGGQLSVVHCVEYTLPGKGGGGFPLHANEDRRWAGRGARVEGSEGPLEPGELERARAWGARLATSLPAVAGTPVQRR